MVYPDVIINVQVFRGVKASARQTDERQARQEQVHRFLYSLDMY